MIQPLAQIQWNLTKMLFWFQNLNSWHWSENDTVRLPGGESIKDVCIRLEISIDCFEREDPTTMLILKSCQVKIAASLEKTVCVYDIKICSDADWISIGWTFAGVDGQLDEVSIIVVATKLGVKLQDLLKFRYYVLDKEALQNKNNSHFWQDLGRSLTLKLLTLYCKLVIMALIWLKFWA